MSLPPGYVCVAAELAGTDVQVLQEKKPQGRGDIGLDTKLDGYWLFSGQTCTYILRKRGVVYAGSAIFVKVTMNNPVFPLQRDSGGNVWTVQMRGKVSPLVGTLGTENYGAITPFTQTGKYF